jgi:general secretion pathway protein D
MRRFLFFLTLVAALGVAPHVLAAAEDAPAPLPESNGILLNFQDAPLKSVLEYLSEAGGFVIIEEAAVQGRVTVMSRQPVNADEAVALLNTVLTEQGFAAVRNDRVLRIVALGDAKKMNVPVHYGSDPAQIAATDEVITQVIPLRYADAKQVRDDLASLIPSHADFSSNESSNALILTDTSANVRRVVEIVRALDTHMATVAEVRVFQLAYANAADAAKLIGDVFKEDSAASSQNQGRAPQFFRGRGQQQNQQPEETTSRAPKVIASADARTNTVVVSGPSDALAVVADVIKQLDSNPVEEESVLVYSLKNAKADNLSELLNTLFGQSSNTATRASATSGTTGGRTGGQNQQANQQPNQQSQRGGRFAQMLSQMSQTNQTTAAGLSGKVYCVADTDTNTILALTAPSNFERLRGIIGELDRAIPQVLIKVLIAELTWSDKLDVGAEFSILHTETDGDMFSLGSDFGLTDLTSGLVYRTVNSDLTAAIRALQENGKLDILSRPHVLTSDNQTATITVGQEVPFIRNTRTTETGQTINTIEYEDIGIILEVTPHINPDGLVIMDVRPEISTTTAETVPISETVDAPVFAKRSAETRIAIKDNQTIVIGGLMQDSETETIRKVPLLGDIPLLGRLFSRKIKNKEKTELLIFLTPCVARDENELAGISERETLNSTKLAEKTRQTE